MEDLGQLAKMTRHGDTLAELRLERARQIRHAPIAPAALAACIADHTEGRDPEANDAQLRAAAVARVARQRPPARGHEPPNPRKPPTTEIEQLLADAPRSSAQVIGYHKVPQLAPPPPPGPPADELARMRAVFPRSTAGECGFHANFALARNKDASSMTVLADSLTAKHAADPEVREALQTLRARVMKESIRSSGDGVLRGVQRRK